MVGGLKRPHGNQDTRTPGGSEVGSPRCGEGGDGTSIRRRGFWRRCPVLPGSGPPWIRSSLDPVLPGSSPGQLLVQGHLERHEALEMAGMVSASNEGCPPGLSYGCTLTGTAHDFPPSTTGEQGAVQLPPALQPDLPTSDLPFVPPPPHPPPPVPSCPHPQPVRPAMGMPGEMWAGPPGAGPGPPPHMYPGGLPPQPPYQQQQQQQQQQGPWNGYGYGYGTGGRAPGYYGAGGGPGMPGPGPGPGVGDPHGPMGYTGPIGGGDPYKPLFKRNSNGLHVSPGEADGRGGRETRPGEAAATAARTKGTEACTGRVEGVTWRESR